MKAVKRVLWSLVASNLISTATYAGGDPHPPPAPPQCGPSEAFLTTTNSYVPGVGKLKLVENEGLNTIEGIYYKCDNSRYDSFCLELDIERGAGACDGTEEIVVTVWAEMGHKRDDTDLFTVIGNGYEYISVANDYDNTYGVRIGGALGDTKGGVFMAPQCDSNSLLFSDDITKLLDGISDTTPFRNRKRLAANNLNNWQHMTHTLVGAGSLSNPVTYKIRNNYKSNTLEVEFESNTIMSAGEDVSCGYKRAFSEYGDIKVMLGADDDVLKIYRVDVKRTCSNKKDDKPPMPKKPKNLVLLIGDGMGTAQNEALRLYQGVEETVLDKYYRGRYTTRTKNQTITDSANGAFVFSSGEKTINGFIGIDVDANPVGSILEAAKLKGRGTGIVSTSRVTHATPASFGTHVFHRNFENLIAKQFIQKNTDQVWIDVLMGGGRRHFLAQNEAGSRRKDNVTVTDYQDYGWNSYVTSNTSLWEAVSQDEINDAESVLPLVGLFSSSHLPYYLDRINMDDELKQSLDYPGLLDMVQAAIDLLDGNYGGDEDNGWFLMVESARIDHCGHVNDIPCVIAEMEEFDEVLDYVFEWAKEDGETLVVTLADHETGGMSIGRTSSVKSGVLESTLKGNIPPGGSNPESVMTNYGSFDYNYLIPVVPEFTHEYEYAYIYDWYPQPIEYTKYTYEYILYSLLLVDDNYDENGQFILSNEEVHDILEENYLGGAYPDRDPTYSPPMTTQEKEFIDSCLYRDNYFHLNMTSNIYMETWGPVFMQCIVMLMNARTLTGWTTHGHSGADASMSCYGPGCDMLAGHHTNAQLGEIMINLFDVKDELDQVTQELIEEFEDDDLVLCDENKNLGFVGYDEFIAWPTGNVKFPGFCVEEYV